MAWKPVELAVIPKQHPSPVGHMLMPEWAGTDSVQYRTPLFSAGLIVDLHRSPVPVTLDILSLGLAKNFQIENARGWPDNRFQVPFHRCFAQLWPIGHSYAR